jgi:hypothetical protein
MSGGNAVLDRFPEVVAVDIFQGSSTEPGKIVVDTVVYGLNEIDEIPRETNLTIYARNYTGSFPKLRLCKKPRIYGGKMRTVWEDQRYKLRDATLAQNYNERDCNGTVFPPTEKSISELVAAIAAATGMTIVASSLPPFKPLAAWRGKRADKAMRELLDIAGLRMVYDPEESLFRVSKAGSGSVSSLFANERRFRPGPEAKIRKVIVKSAPRTFEERFTATAVVLNGDNEIETVDASENIFSNFSNIDGFEPTKRSRYIQTAMKLWQVDASEDKCLLGRRALSVMPGDDDQTYAGARIIRPELADVPQYVPLVQQVGFEPSPLGLTGGGKLFACEHPYIEVDGGVIKTTATVLCAFYEIEDGKFKRDEVTREVNPLGETDLDFTLDWIRPFESTEDDIDGSSWSTLHGEVADAIAARYSEPPQHVTVATLVPHGGVGQIGAVRYMLNLEERKLETSIALNFEPKDSRGL